MKKFIAIVIVIASIFIMTACSNTDDDQNGMEVITKPTLSPESYKTIQDANITTYEVYSDVKITASTYKFGDCEATIVNEDGTIQNQKGEFIKEIKNRTNSFRCSLEDGITENDKIKLEVTGTQTEDSTYRFMGIIDDTDISLSAKSQTANAIQFHPFTRQVNMESVVGSFEYCYNKSSSEETFMVSIMGETIMKEKATIYINYSEELDTYIIDSTTTIGNLVVSTVGINNSTPSDVITTTIDESASQYQIKINEDGTSTIKVIQ